MRPRDLVQAWVAAFNKGDAVTLAAFYDEDAVNHQVTQDPVEGRAAIQAMNRTGPGFSLANTGKVSSNQPA